MTPTQYGFALVVAFLLGCPATPRDTAPTDTGASEQGCVDNAWIDVSLGYYRACGVHEDGCVECWGDVKADAVNDTAWTNYGLLDPPSVTATSVSVETDTTDDGEPTVCVVDTDGEVVCWGRPLLAHMPDHAGAERVQVQGRRDVVVQTITGAVSRYEYSVETHETTVQDLGPAERGKVWAGVAGTCLIDEQQLRCTNVHPEESFELQGVMDAGVGYNDVCWTDLAGTLQCRVLRPGLGDEPLAPPPGAFRSPCAHSVACALDTDNRAVCWLTLDYPTPWPHWTPPADVALADLRCGPDGGCGITSDGKLHCFGDDSSVNRPPGSFVVP